VGHSQQGSSQEAYWVLVALFRKAFILALFSQNVWSHSYVVDHSSSPCRVKTEVEPASKIKFTVSIFFFISIFVQNAGFLAQ
jgi:hypothetical protein